jgi:hypothetical protein
VEGRAPDPVAIAMWHLALDSTIAVEVPHDLFALWLFPVSGGVILLGPEALAQDKVAVPLPEPHLLQDQLFQLEEVLRRAKYSSALAVPVRCGGRDVAVLLVGSFGRGVFGPPEALGLQRLASGLSAPLADLAEVLSATTPHPALEPEMSRDTLPEHLARAAAEAADGLDLVRRVSGVLYPLLPHDRLEILAAGAVENAFVPLSGNAPRRRWSGGGGVVEPFVAIVARFDDSPTLLVDDFTEIDRDAEWAIGSGATPHQPARGILGARLEVGGRLVGFLLMGSVARDAYRPEDEDTIAVAALLVATRVASFRLAAHVESLRAQIDAVDTPSLPLIRSAEALSTMAHLRDGLDRFAEGMRALLPHERITLHLRWGDDDVIRLDPAAPRPFADLPTVALEEFEGSAVLRGEREWLVRSVPGGEEVVVPLSVAGRTIGCLGVVGRTFRSTRDAATIARQFANILAPHLELLRRGAALQAPRLGATVGK